MDSLKMGKYVRNESMHSEGEREGVENTQVRSEEGGGCEEAST